jgi:hypothetical protein
VVPARVPRVGTETAHPTSANGDNSRTKELSCWT